MDKMLADVFVLWQISLLEMPEHSRKNMMALTNNIMRDPSDKVVINFVRSSVTHLIVHLSSS